ncbi:MAG: hypothetical protein OHK0039_26340 [Bacteroidia bacterium]
MKRQVKVGLVVILAILVLYITLLWTRRSGPFGGQQRTYVVLFDNVNGLLEGDPVVVRGFASGRVTRIAPDTHLVRVFIDLRADVPVYSNASAEIQIKELMGGKQIALDPGNTSPRLADGAEIAGRSSLDFSTAFSTVESLVGKIDLRSTEALLGRADSLARQANRIAYTLDPDEMLRMAAGLQVLASRVDRLLLSLERQQVIERTGSALVQVDSLLASLQQELAEIQTMTADLRPQVDTLLRQGGDMMVRVDGLMMQGGQVMDQLSDSSVLAGRLLYDRALSRSLDTTIYELNKTLEMINNRKFIVGFRRKPE